MEQIDLMESNPISLNLARKWRSSQFPEIIGQDLVVRILQNSLFKNQFFPVYLMSGQRGCGKTSTARVFAAAVNCFQLAEFQKNPKIQIPCLQCDSCRAMKMGHHPDFIEIDAASYTGVDNIRNIIDTSSFLPVLGHRKIYLIDEVHMLSKAAFNALLKILEEPSKSVLFILATTEAQKIPDTVRSRCFQLLFNPVVEAEVVNHLQRVCDKEAIAYELAGLTAIAQATQGSMRDAINLLEQARFSAASVSKASVIAVLGYVDDQLLYQIISAMISQNAPELLSVMRAFHLKTISTEYVLKRLLELLYDCVIIKYGSNPKYGSDVPELLMQQIQDCKMVSLIYWFDELCQLDMVISKTSKKQLLLESMLIRLVAPEYQNRHVVDDQKKNDRAVEPAAPKNQDEHLWKQFVQTVSAHIDPVLASILYATDLVQFDRSRQMVEVVTLKKFVLFQDLFLEQKHVYQEYLNRLFGFQAILVVQFAKVEAPVVIQPRIAPTVSDNAAPVVMAPRPQASFSVSPGTVKRAPSPAAGQFYQKRPAPQQPAPVALNERAIDVTDTKKWKITHSLLQHFGGTVREIIKDTHEFDA